MSYCRWSTDDFQSDVYVYESDSGFMIHVAAAHPIMKNLPPKVDLTDYRNWRERYDKVSQILKNAPREPIDEQYAGRSFIYSTAKECAEELQKMQAVGVYVPDGVIESLFGEHEASDSAEK